MGDGLDFLASMAGRGATSSAAWEAQQVRSLTRSLSVSSGGYSPYRAGIPRGSTRSFSAPYKPAAFPERVDITLPWSSSAEKLTRPRASTQGDFLGSLGASFDNAIGQGGYLNLGNAVPWAMERSFVMASEAAKGLTSDDDNIVSGAVDFVGAAVKGISDILAPVIEWFPNTVRDIQLNQRTSVYRALVKGETLGPFETLMSHALSMIGLNSSYLATQGQMAGQLGAVQRSILAASIDLPTSVKKSIQTDPNGDLAKYLDAAEEGRQFTYMGGLAGGLVNAASYLTLYGIEIFATAGVAGAAGAAGATSTVPAIAFSTRALAAAAKGIHMVQKAFLATGMGYFGVTTTLDAIARTQGNQAAVEWFDRMNRTAIISDSPSVQLVTSFSVNPFGAAGMVKSSAGKVVRGLEFGFDTATRRKFTRLYTGQDAVRKVIQTAYRTSKEGVDEFVGPAGAYDTWSDATDRVVEFAVDHLAATKVITEQDVALFHAITNGRERTKAVLAKYGAQIVNVIRNEPAAVAGRLWRDWEYHGFAGPFDPRIARIVERDYVTAKKASEALRDQNDLVVGYVDLLGPEGQTLARNAVDDLFARGDVTLQDLNALNVQFPALKDLYRDLVVGKSADEAVSRGVFDTVLGRAAEKYAETSRKNPIKATTGVDPILRPTSRTPTRDMAEALGTTEDTVTAIGKNPQAWSAEESDLVRAFAREKQIVGDVELAALPPETLWTRVSEWVDDTTAPWRAEGERVAAVEEQIVTLAGRVAELDDLVARGQTEWRAEATALRAEQARLQVLLANSHEPMVPFTQGVRFAQRESLNIATVERATRKLDAQDRLDKINAIDGEVGAWNTISPLSPLTMIRQTREGTWGWAGKAPAMSDSLFAKLQQFLIDYGGDRGRAQARSMGEMGDEELWRLMTSHRDAGPLRRELTGSQRKLVDRVDVRSSSLDEYQSAWARAREGGVGSEDDFLAYLGRTREARDALLDGTSEYQLARTAGAKVPEWAVNEAKSGGDPALWHDAEATVAREANRQKLGKALDGGEATFPAVRQILDSDPLLAAEAEQIAAARGMDLDTALADAANAEMLRPLVGAVGEEIIPGVPRALTDIDQAILANDPAGFEALKGELDNLRGRIAPPKRNVPIEAAATLARQPRPSVVLAGELADAGVGWHEIIPAEAWSGFEVGAKVASVILHGNMSFPPRTPRAVLSVLKEIENGNAANLGIGPDLLAEAQRATRHVAKHLVGEARKAQVETGVLGMGRGLNPYTITQETQEMLRDLLGKHGEKAGIVVRDDRMGIQYGLKQRPTKALVIEMSRVPGLAEELLASHFQPWNERVGIAHIRQAFNTVFGPRHNQQVFYESRARFAEALASKFGVDAKLAEKVWAEWKDLATTTRERAIVNLYASERNIPDRILNRVAQEQVREAFKGAPDVVARLEKVNFAEEFRLATSWTRRSLDSLPLGTALSRAYGVVAHNDFTTFMYYLFRFGIDLRFHALNALEGPMLYAGRSSLRQDAGRLIVGDEGLFGYTRARLEALAKDGLNDTGYPFSQSRTAWAYQAFLKEQPDALRRVLRDDPALMRDALDSLARLDPELATTIKAMGDTPESYLRAMDRHYRKILDSADPAAAVSDEIMREAVSDPALAELFGKLAAANADLWGNVRGTFFGNPARSNAERVLNHYLLYWPISYQIKATKWLARVMFDRVGGMRTNTAGAYAFDELQSAHMDLMANDPEYRQTIDEHPNLVFLAQMLFPMTPASIGVSLSPLTRDIFFGRSKGVLEVGPVYTITKVLPGAVGELYQDFSQVPGMDILARTVGLDTPEQP